MAQFIHITDAKRQKSIQTNGIRKNAREGGVFCMPVLQDHLTTHQWIRQLRRGRQTPKIVVQFRIPDNEIVSVGHYNKEKIEVSASEAVGIVKEHDSSLGLEIVVKRKITSKEIMKFYTPPKVVGWRHWPEAKGHKPCPCSYCQRGMPYSKKIRERFDG